MDWTQKKNQKPVHVSRQHDVQAALVAGEMSDITPQRDLDASIDQRLTRIEDLLKEIKINQDNMALTMRTLSTPTTVAYTPSAPIARRINYPQ